MTTLIVTNNCATFIEEFLVSVINQTVSVFKVLIADDLFDVKTYQIVNEFIVGGVDV